MAKQRLVFELARYIRKGKKEHSSQRALLLVASRVVLSEQFLLVQMEHSWIVMVM
jgi:hypothetical protein